MKGTSNRVGMATLKEIMSGDITSDSQLWRKVFKATSTEFFRFALLFKKTPAGHQNRFENLY